MESCRNDFWHLLAGRYMYNLIDCVYKLVYLNLQIMETLEKPWGQTASLC